MPHAQTTARGNTLVYYQPQVDDWKAFTDLSWRMAFSLTPAGGKEAVGVVEVRGHTDVDNDNKTVLVSGLTIVRSRTIVSAARRRTSASNTAAASAEADSAVDFDADQRVSAC